MATPTTLPATFVAGSVLTAAQMNDLRGAFRILQFKEAQVTTNQAFTSTSFIDVTGATVSITPSSTSSKIFIISQINQTAANGTPSCQLRLMRDATQIFETQVVSLNFDVVMNNLIHFLDNPATTSATTYKLQVATGTSQAQTINNSVIYAFEVSL